MRSEFLARMKGQNSLTIGSIPAIVLTLVLVGFYLSFGALITNDLGVTTRIAQPSTVTNASLGTVLVNVPVTITGAGFSPSTYVVVQVVNSSATGQLVNTGNYTFVDNGATATFTLTDARAYNNTALKVTYTYSYQAETLATNATINTETALNTFSSRLPLLALVLLFAIILSVIAVLAATGRVAV